MATRRGRYGRLPRSQPSLASAIISLAQEAQNRSDSNLLNAWQKGGDWEGKPVTDEMVLAHWKERMESVSPGDPQYDTYKQTYDQLDYNISESKTYLLYKQGKINDMQMAQFYLDWAKKVPPNSEFYRTLQGDAAQFIQAAKARGRAGAAKAAQEAYDKGQQKIMDRDVRLGLVLTDLVTSIARVNGLIGENQDLSDLTLEGQNLPGRLESLLGQYNSMMHADPTGWADTIAAIKAADPTWDGNLTSGYFAHALQQQTQGYAAMSAFAAKNGKTDDTNKFRKAGAAANSLGGLIGSFPVAAAYSRARETFESIWNSKAATDADKYRAAQDFADAIDVFAASPNVTDRQANTLRNDASALRGNPAAAGLPSFYENFNGITNQTAGQTGIAGGEQTGDNARFSAAMEQLSFWSQTYSADPASYTYASYTEDEMGNRVFDPTGKGPVGVVPRSSVDNDPAATVAVPVPTLTGGAIMQTVVKQPVIVDNPAGGEGEVVGSVIVTYAGGQRVVTYGLERPDGTTDWTPVNPFGDDVTLKFGKDGLHLTVPLVFDRSADARAIEQSYNVPGVSAAFANGATPQAGASWWGKDPKSGQKVIVKWDGTQFTTQTETTIPSGRSGSVTPPVPFNAEGTHTAIVQSVWDQSRLSLPPDPRKDFTTPAVANLVATRTSGSAVLDAWASPVFQMELQRQEIEAAGGLNNLDVEKLRQVALIDAGIARTLVGSPTADYGSAATAPSFIRALVAAQRVKEFDKINAVAQQVTRRDRTGDTPSEITLGHTINIPNYTMPGQKPFYGIGPNAQPLVSPDHPALLPQGPKVPEVATTPAPIPGVATSPTPIPQATPAPTPAPITGTMVGGTFIPTPSSMPTYPSVSQTKRGILEGMT